MDFPLVVALVTFNVRVFVFAINKIRAFLNIFQKLFEPGVPNFFNLFVPILLDVAQFLDLSFEPIIFILEVFNLKLQFFKREKMKSDTL